MMKKRKLYLSVELIENRKWSEESICKKRILINETAYVTMTYCINQSYFKGVG